MYDEDSGEEILCPYCDSSEDCPHRLPEQIPSAVEKPLRFPSGREVAGINKRILENCLRDHPALTVEECLEMMEAFGC